ncbi:flagellar associated protein [Thecamonas trahens ATCC 50062]|uniref:Flagellar associated protein n=1 Tax=Thecamonas trahens ATCC 50062 TaxID=461836 RepID=A0A0L0DFB3_THETB|nr:flagellar associated protein [Thecamonas trahens ATCC 50062]KNC50915.1 flagellar associated protein [Thecamonas trahens ATCC 50062]|eukprot:XP_013756615.1 flagellar associated protein [Thecamonas trahens ATCC 50062]
MAEPGSATTKELEELGIEASAFEALERDFQETLQQLVGDSSLAKFRQEYSKLHRALSKSYASEKRLLNRCKALQGEIVSNSAKVQQALKMSQEDQKTIAQLTKEIEKAWKMVDVANAKEAKAKETINSLREAIDKLKKLVEQGAGFSIGQENSVNELFRVKEELQKEVDLHVAKINQLRLDINAERERTSQLQAEKAAAEQQITMLQEAIRTRVVEFGRETQEKQKLNKELDDLRRELASSQDEINAKNESIASLQDQLQYTLAEVDQQKAEVENYQSLLGQMESNEAAAKDALNKAHETIVQLQGNAKEQNNLLDQHKAEIERTRKLVRDEQRKYAALQEKVVQAKNARNVVEAEKADLLKAITELNHQLELETLAKREQDRVISSLSAQTSKLKKGTEKERTKTDAQKEVVRKLANDRKVLETHIDKYKKAAQDHRKKIHELGLKKDKFRSLTMELSTKLLQTQEELKIKDLVIFDKKKKLREAKVKLKQQQMLYEAVRSDRNLYSKQLIEAQDDIAEYKRKFDILNHQIDQLKEEIVVKEQAIFTEHMTHMRVQKDFAAKQIQLSVLGSQIYEARKFQQAQAEELSKLKHIINEADTERMRQKKALEAARNERDILGTQLIRRNDELALLYEKLSINRYTLEKGEKQYAQRVKEIRALKSKNKELRRQLKLLDGQTAHVDSLKMAVFQLQRELLQERNRVKALSEELENPMNIHRWRKLEGTDPDKYDLIRKIHTLQKRLIAKTEEVVEKELLIQQKEKYYIELKNVLARQPGPEVAEQLNVYQASLKAKTRELKALAAELNMSVAQVNEFKYENERLARELNSVKKRFFEMKKKETRRKRAAAEDKAAAAPTASPGKIPVQPDPDMRRFAGGGFAIQ